MITDNTDAASSFVSPAWSLDSKRLAFSYQKATPDGTTDGLSIVAPGEPTAGLYETPDLIRLLGWTSDETGLIVAETTTTKSLPAETVLKRVAVTSGKETVIAALKNTYFYNIFLSDDRKSIAYAARNDDNDDIWIIPSMGGTPVS